MALPAIGPLAAFAGKQLAGLGIWKVGSGALKGIVPKVKGVASKAGQWIKNNPLTAAKGGTAGGVLGGAWVTISDTLSAVGIKDGQLQLVVVGGVGLAALAAAGQFFDYQLGGGE